MSEKYDVIIIGGGLSGLIAGCYLSKHGAKVAIIEKNSSVGGFCSSFRRKGFTFDSTVHSLGSCRENGQFGKIFTDFNMYNEISIKKAELSDVIIRGDDICYITSGVNNVIKEFQNRFPGEKENIKSFFNMINRFDINSNASFIIYYKKFSKINFETFLNNYFNNKDLKSLLAVFLGNAGLSAYDVSCLSAIAMFKEFVLDGGYFVKGGMQQLSNLLLKKFIEYGGKVRLSSEVVKITLKNRNVSGVILKNKQSLLSSYIISASDVRTTFLKLIGEEHLGVNIVRKLKNLVPSVSGFVVYIGMKKKVKNVYGTRALWYVPINKDINKFYGDTFRNKLDLDSKFLLCTFPSENDDTLAPPDSSVMQLYTLVPFLNEKFWIKNKKLVTNKLIKRVEEILPEVCENIVVVDSASPLTLFRYTNNYRGACYGWASTIDQSSATLVRPKSLIDGLYLTGHWVTYGAGQGGTPMVAYAGRKIAEMVLNRLLKK